MVQRLINRVMRDGKKQIAERLVYEGMEKAAKKLKNDNVLEVFDKAIKNATPYMETRSRRVGGANYQIPFEVKGQRQKTPYNDVVRCCSTLTQRCWHGRSYSYGAG